MTAISEFNTNPCPSIDPTEVNAYFDLYLDESTLTTLTLENSWGETSVDLTSAVKEAETITHLMLDPASAPEYLRFDNEAGDSECIRGDDLSRIISMTRLKDVAQDAAPTEGEVYMLGEDGLFHPHDLAEYEEATDARIEELEEKATNLEQRLYQAEQAIEELQRRLLNSGS